ncbi:BTAD domain-containing putative transcriptional regulator [Saccharothrix longispora]|uniref:DNA-binding SARP family transcriptional activator n=1 Tax=Saccharothrix longispora TaxID=33920 RepID=A0ABU1PV49_9PSEU|nr:BTAD domain-containing putative transcriptional regulator [Saccharothrix longispora]MDR6594511.1 DNA-binding SARP family transcriptional activator [Saccharothrix longispora]
MLFEVLGSAHVVRPDGARTPLAARKPRLLLSLLLLHANEPVRTARIVDELWGATPPRSAPGNVKTYVSDLRRLVADPGRIVGGRSEYTIRVNRDELDVFGFEDAVSRGAGALADGEPADAARHLAAALALWRGEPFAGLDGPDVDAVRARLGERRLTARAHLVRALLALERHDEAAAVAREAVVEHPFREDLRALLMTALHRMGRSAEALEVYADARRVLDRELGLSPGAELRRLHAAVLDRGPRAGGREVGVAQLPAAPPVFVGRGPELGALDAALGGGVRKAAVISAVAGAGGIGKTSLALLWAHRHRDRFPDGQLYVDLRGFSPDGPPLEPAAVLRGFLGALGVEPTRMPVDQHARTALLRSLLAGRRALLVLDNAADAAQVVPLLPGDDSCAVVITSRARLPGLVAGFGARQFVLGPLTGAESRHLLVGRLGRAQVDAEPAAVVELVRLCGGFPLALTVIAGHAHAQPGLPLASLVDQLHDSAFDVLDERDPMASLPAVLSWSRRALTVEQDELFSLLGTAPGPDTDLLAATALAGLPRSRVRSALRALEQVSLVERTPTGRYRMHDLIRRYAADAADRLPNSDRREALRRVVDFHLRTAHAADRLLHPHRPPLRLPPSCAQPHPLPDEAAALAWFDAEHACLLAAQHTAATEQRHHVVWQLAWCLDTFHHRRGLLQDQVLTWSAGLAAAEHLDDTAVRARAHRSLGRAHSALRRHDLAVAHLDRALAAAEALDDRPGRAHTHFALANARDLWEEHEPALHHAHRCLDLYRELGNTVWTARALNLVGWCAARAGDHATAREHCRAALALYENQDDPDGRAATLDSLGYIAHRVGRHHESVERYQQALALRHRIGDTFQEAQSLEGVGHPHAALGRHDRARAAWRAALRVYRDSGLTEDAARVRRWLDGLGCRT